MDIFNELGGEKSKPIICEFIDRIHREITLEKGITDFISLKTFLENIIIDNEKYLNSVIDVECSNFYAYEVYLICAKIIYEYVSVKFNGELNIMEFANSILKNYWFIVDDIYFSQKIKHL